MTCDLLEPLLGSTRRHERNNTLSRCCVLAGASALAFILAIPWVALGQSCNFPIAGVPPFTPDTSLPIRERKAVHQLSTSEVARLRLAYQRLRELSLANPADPIGWQAQANVHNCYCGGGTAEIHRSFFFFPWHRAFLYFHERILAKLLNDQSFTLPYWAWDEEAQNFLPLIYGPQVGAANPLFDANRAVNAPFNMGLFSPSTQVKAALTARFPLAFLGDDRAAGQLEQSPHNGIHAWVAGNLPNSPARPDMGRTDTAALDPVFFAHHANVDRMWNKWLNQGEGRANHSSTTFLNQRWTFFDENRTAVSISTADVLNHEALLRYRYDMPVSANVSTPAAKPTTILTIPLDSAPGSDFPSPRTFRVVPDPVTQFPVLIGARPEFGAGVLLQIEGLDFTANESVFVNIFWGKPDANAATPVSDPAFVGMISNFPDGGGAGHAHLKSDSLFEVTDKANALPFGGQISVTLVPTTLAGLPPLSVPLTFDAVRILVVKQL